MKVVIQLLKDDDTETGNKFEIKDLTEFTGGATFTILYEMTIGCEK